MANFRRSLNLTLFASLTLVVTSLWPPLGAPAIKALRRRLGRVGFWAFLLPIVAVTLNTQAGWLGLILLNLAILVGLFQEFEESGFNFSMSFFLTLLIYGLASAGVFAIWAVYAGPTWSQVLRASVEASLAPMSELAGQAPFNADQIMGVLPALAMVNGAMALFLSVLTENRFNTGELASDRPLTMRSQLESFRVPDIGIWLFIASILGRFGDFHMPTLQTLSVNTMFVCLALFLIQGMMVILKYIDTLRMHGVLQLLFGIFCAAFAAPIGFMDYWLGFRDRLSKRAEQFNREM
jgi:hypothetical protein